MYLRHILPKIRKRPGNYLSSEEKLQIVYIEFLETKDQDKVEVLCTYELKIIELISGTFPSKYSQLDLLSKP